jgi:hypothetical protein
LLSNKKEREREEERGGQREEKSPLFHPIPEIMYSSFLLISFAIDMKG